MPFDKELRFIVFDCDGTLVDSGHNVVSTMQGAFEAENLPPPADSDIRQQIGLHLLEVIENLHPEGERDAHLRLREHYRDVAHAKQDSDDLSEPLYPGCEQVLRDLHARGAVLGVATGKGRRGLIHTLENHGLSEIFTCLKTADDGPGKPHPQILEDAMAEVGANPWNTVVIGDTIFDINLAINAKAHGLGVSWGYHPPTELERAGAHAVANTYDEIPKLLETIWA